MLFVVECPQSDQDIDINAIYSKTNSVREKQPSLR